MFESSSRASELMVNFREQKGKILVLSKSPTQSRFFSRFSNGLLERMGRHVKSDLALNYRILQVILTNLEEELSDVETLPARRRWIQVLGTYSVIYFVCSLRGNEGFMVELGGII